VTDHIEYDIQITRHADIQARKRFGLKRKAVKAFATRAVYEGEELKVLHRNLTENPRRMFVFRGATLIFADYRYKLVLLTITNANSKEHKDSEKIERIREKNHATLRARKKSRKITRPRNRSGLFS
jgi:hypothetical protein